MRNKRLGRHSQAGLLGRRTRAAGPSVSRETLCEVARERRTILFHVEHFSHSLGFSTGRGAFPRETSCNQLHSLLDFRWRGDLIGSSHCGC